MIKMAKSAFGLSLAPMFGNSVASAADFVPNRPRAAKSVIFLMMAGGMSHLDTWDVKPGNATVMGKTKTIDTTAAGIQISENLPKSAKQLQHMVLMNGMNTTQGAHEQGQYLLERSYTMRGTIVHPAMGSWVMRLAGKRNHNIPGFVSISGDPNLVNGGFMGAKFAGVPIGDPNAGLQDSIKPGSISEDDFTKRLKLADSLNKQFHTVVSSSAIRDHEGLYSDALRIMRSEDLKAFDLTKEPTEIKEFYGPSRFAQGCLLARRLVEHGVRFIQVTHGGWDTHYDNFTTVPARCKDLDDGFSALLADLHRRGMLEETLVVVATEFGRTPEIVSEHEDGRDHYPKAFSCVLAGGGIKGGRTYGKTDASGSKVVENLTTPQDFNATIAHSLGLPVEQVVISPSGRPFTVADKGKAVTALFA
ncbi:MAG: DUF1501 domain-containing protein [Verrucomicrobiaceae bacterium]|nr:MAG: DUF1501 domain-containing protein [Verrucomicrobiaceae bacterium]